MGWVRNTGLSSGVKLPRRSHLPSHISALRTIASLPQWIFVLRCICALWYFGRIVYRAHAHTHTPWWYQNRLCQGTISKQQPPAYRFNVIVCVFSCDSLRSGSGWLPAWENMCSPCLDPVRPSASLGFYVWGLRASWEFRYKLPGVGWLVGWIVRGSALCINGQRRGAERIALGPQLQCVDSIDPWVRDGEVVYVGDCYWQV